jgi:hypothetical protein
MSFTIEATFADSKQVYYLLPTSEGVVDSTKANGYSWELKPQAKSFMRPEAAAVWLGIMVEKITTFHGTLSSLTLREWVQ